MTDRLPKEGTEEPGLTRGDLVENLFDSIPGLKERFDSELWEHEMPDGTLGSYGIIEQLLTRGCIIPAVTGGDDSHLDQAVRFVERMLVSADDEVRSTASISVGEPLGWNGTDLAAAVFRSDRVSLTVKELVWEYARSAQDAPGAWRTGTRPF